MNLQEIKELNAAVKAKVDGYDEEYVYHVVVKPEDSETVVEFSFLNFEGYAHFVGHMHLHGQKEFVSAYASSNSHVKLPEDYIYEPQWAYPDK